MSSILSAAAKAKLQPGVVVERPRASDAVGGALRDAFGREGGGVPMDMIALLQRIDVKRTVKSPC